jgi:hypothetical protein
MAERPSEGDNDPMWMSDIPSGSESLVHPKPPAIPQQVLKAWWYRMLQSAGPPV